MFNLRFTFSTYGTCHFHERVASAPAEFGGETPGATQHNSKQIAQLDTTQQNTIQHNTTQHNSTQRNTTRHDTTRHDTTQHNTTIYTYMYIYIYIYVYICIHLVRHGNRQGVFVLWFLSSTSSNIFVVYGFRRWLFNGFRRRRKRFLCFYGFRRWFFCYGFRRGRKTFRYGFRRWFFNGFRRGKERFCMVSVVGCFYAFRLLQDRGSLSDGSHKKQHQDASVTN